MDLIAQTLASGFCSHNLSKNNNDFDALKVNAELVSLIGTNHAWRLKLSMSADVRSCKDLATLASQAQRPKTIYLYTSCKSKPTEEDVAAVLHKDLEKLSVFLDGRGDRGPKGWDESWGQCLFCIRQPHAPQTLQFSANASGGRFPRSASLGIVQMNMVTKLEFSYLHFPKMICYNLSKSLELFKNLKRLYFSVCRFYGPIGKLMCMLLQTPDSFLGAWCHSHQRDLARLLQFRDHISFDRQRGCFVVGNASGELPVDVMKALTSAVEKLSGATLGLSDVAAAYGGDKYLRSLKYLNS